MNKVVIGIDIGTSGCKAIALDGRGEILGRANASYPMQTPHPGWAEQDPAVWNEATDVAMRQLVVQLPDPHAVGAIGLSGQMHGLVALDAADRVLRPAILWCDNRTERECAELTELVGGDDALLRLTNNRMLPGYTGGKIAWLQRHEPDIHRAMRRFLLPKDAVRLRMTGEHATDVSDASGTGLFDVRARAWSHRMLEAVGLEPDQVPHALESHETAGTLRAEIARAWGLPPGITVVAGGGDSVVQTTSMGIVDSGLVGVTIGTAGIVGGSSPICPDNHGALLQVSCGNAPGCWHVMGVTLNGGGALQWLRDALRPAAPNNDAAMTYARLVELAEGITPGAEGLAFLPSLLGERCPMVAPGARAAFVGLRQGHDLRHMSRALLEGVLLNIRSILELMRGAGLGWHTVRASGGATASPTWMHMLADILGQDVVTVSGAEEGGAFGAALIAGVGIGIWATLEDALSVIRETDRVVPNRDAARVYDRLHNAHARLAPALAPLHAALAEAARG